MISLDMTILLQRVSYDDGGSDSESDHDVYLERVKAEGQERDSEDGMLSNSTVTTYNSSTCLFSP